MSSVLSMPLDSDPSLGSNTFGLPPASMTLPGQSMVPQANRLARNPMLPQHPLGAFTDSQYEADDAVLRANVAKQQADLLQQLGYMDENGNFIQGSVEAEANKQDQDYIRQQQLAREQVTREAQANGTLFSGLRGTLQARAEDPFVRGRADLLQQTPLALQHLYEQTAGLTGDYVLQQNQLLAAAAARRAAALINNPPAADAPAAAGDAAGAAAAPADTGASTLPPGSVSSFDTSGAIVRNPGAPFGQTVYNPETNIVSGGQPILEHAPGIPIITLPKILQPGQNVGVGQSAVF